MAALAAGIFIGILIAILILFLANDKNKILDWYNTYETILDGKLYSTKKSEYVCTMYSSWYYKTKNNNWFKVGSGDAPLCWHLMPLSEKEVKTALRNIITDMNQNEKSRTKCAEVLKLYFNESCLITDA